MFVGNVKHFHVKVDIIFHVSEIPFALLYRLAAVCGEHFNSFPIAMKDISARDFDSDDEDEFDAYYDKLDEWNLRHRWHPASSGAILADVYFQLIGDEIEISWNNEDNGDGIKFQNLLGGARIKKDVFYATVDTFLKAYANHWLT